jgi:putative ABC transport system permease protein
VLRIALRDLQWRRRRFLIAVFGTAVLFGLTLSTTGISSGFDVEAGRTVSQLRVGTWIVGKGAVGPFLGSSPMAASTVAEVAALPGVSQAVPTVFTRKDLVTAGRPSDVNIFGAPAGSLGMPAVSAGRAPQRPGEIAVSTKLGGYDLGAPLSLAGHRFVVVGKVPDSTALAGVPNVFLTLSDAQLVAFDGQPVASAIAVAGSAPAHLPAGLVALGPGAAQADLVRALKQARTSIYLTAVLSWIVAAMIIGSVILMSVLERQRDFAVFKAVGVTTNSILGGLALQAVLLAFGAAVIGSGISLLLSPKLQLPVSVGWHTYLLLPLVAIVVGLLASLVGLRRVVAVDPAMAFGGP